MAKTKEELELISTQLKAQHKPLYEVTVPASDESEDDTRTIFLKKIDRQTLSAFQKTIISGDSLRAIEIFLKNTYVGGDDLTEILNDLDMFRSLESVVIDLMAVKKASIKKN